MNIKALWTNYKIYGIIIGIVLGTIVYNMISIDFSFSNIHNIKNIDFLDSYVFFAINFLKFYILIFLISFFRVKEKVYAFLLAIESFKMAGSIVILIRMHNIMCATGIVESLFKIAAIFFMIKNEKKY